MTEMAKNAVSAIWNLLVRNNTMGATDKSSREIAVPFVSNILNYQRTSASDLDVSLGSVVGIGSDLGGFTYAPQLQNPIRMLRPYHGDITQAYLTVQVILVSGEPQTGLKVAIGKFQKDKNGLCLSDPEATLDQATIDQHHLTLTGSGTAFYSNSSGIININNLNIASLIPKRGSSNFQDDAYILMMVYDRVPASGGGYHVSKFKVIGAATMGVENE